MSEEKEETAAAAGPGSLVAELQQCAAVSTKVYALMPNNLQQGLINAYEDAARIVAVHESRWQAERQAHAALVEGLRQLADQYRQTTYESVVGKIDALLAAHTSADGGGIGRGDGGGTPPATLTYEQRSEYACKVCQNVPDEYGTIEHGRGCFVVSEDGGGTSFVDMTEGQAQ